MKTNRINHPDYYNIPGHEEAIVEMVKQYGIKDVIGFCKCNFLKYTYRARYKESEEQDMAKARWYKKAAEDFNTIMMCSKLKNVENPHRYCVDAVREWSKK